MDGTEAKREAKSVETPIVLSEEAIKQAKRLQQENNEWNEKPLRVYLGGKGCDGFTYGVCFDETLEEDLVFEQNGIFLVVDKEAHDFLQGSMIEWVDDERGAGFLVENPNHKKFRGKFFKRKTWREKLLPN